MIESTYVVVFVSLYPWSLNARTACMFVFVGCPDVALNARNYFQFDTPALAEQTDYRWTCTFLHDSSSAIEDAEPCFDSTTTESIFGAIEGE